MSEFVSDAFDSCKINEDDLRKEMEQLVLDKREEPNTHEGTLLNRAIWTGIFVFSAATIYLCLLVFSEETAEWERELQEELQEYDVLADNEHHDDNWDKEIEDMLKEEN